MRWLTRLLLVIALVLAVRWSFYTVDAAEFAYVTVLGAHAATHDGADGQEGAGLHVGWPWPIQNVQRLDRRLQKLDLQPQELLTHDPEGKTIDKSLSVEAYVLWRIVDRDAVDLFVQRLGTAQRAGEILGPRINSQLGAAISQMRVDDLVSIEPGQQPGSTHVDETIARLQARLLGSLQQPVRDEYGIELVDLRLRRFSYSPEVRASIYERIRSERAKKVAEYKSEGDRRAENVRSTSEEKKRDMLAKARFEEEQIKGRADREALQIRNEAQSHDPEFYAFLKQMEQLQSILGGEKAMLLLSTHRPLFERLFQPPRPQVQSEERKETKKDGENR